MPRQNGPHLSEFNHSYQETGVGTHRGQIQFGEVKPLLWLIPRGSQRQARQDSPLPCRDPTVRPIQIERPVAQCCPTGTPSSKQWGRRAIRERKGQRVRPASAANPGRKALPDRPAAPVLPDPREIPVPRQPFVLSPGRDQSAVGTTNCWSRSCAAAAGPRVRSAQRRTRRRRDCAYASDQREMTGVGARPAEVGPLSGGSGRLTPPSINRRHPDSLIARTSW
jgi:hypothetical protein